jgi:hypothetical protein
VEQEKNHSVLECVECVKDKNQVIIQVTIDYLSHLESGNVNMTKKAKLQKVIKGLNKASKLHASQAKVLKGMVKKDKTKKA